VIGEGKMYAFPGKRCSAANRDIAERESAIILGRPVFETGTNKVLPSQFT
jgi:hypothetical protein